MSERTKPAIFRLAEPIDVELSEPSDVAALPGGLFVVVSDIERKAGLATPGGTVEHIPPRSDHGDGESGFEAVTFDPE